MKTELNWEVAPHWATCAAMDSGGTWYFYRHTPKWDESGGVWDAFRSDYERAPLLHPLPHESLTPRPEDK